MTFLRDCRDDDEANRQNTSRKSGRDSPDLTRVGSWDARAWLIVSEPVCVTWEVGTMGSSSCSGCGAKLTDLALTTPADNGRRDECPTGLHATYQFDA